MAVLYLNVERQGYFIVWSHTSYEIKNPKRNIWNYFSWNEIGLNNVAKRAAVQKMKKEQMCWLCAPFSHICISLEHLHRRMTVALISLVVCVVWRDCCRGFLAWLNTCCLLWSRVFDWKSRWEERRIRIEEAAVKPAGGSEGTVWKTGMSRKVWKTKKSRGAVSVRQLVGPGSGPGSGVFGCASTVQVSPLLWPSEPDCWNWFSRASATCKATSNCCYVWERLVQQS